MLKLSRSDIIRRTSSIFSTVVDSDTILLHLENEKYYGINSVGSRIWELLEMPIAVERIFGILSNEFDVTPEQCEHEVYEFLSLLLKERLIHVVA